MQTTALFDRGAAHYDLLVGLNPGYHRELQRAARAVSERVRDRGARPRVIDLACGSGASTRALLDAVGEACVLGIDASAGMLAEAKAKDWPEGTRFAQASAGALKVTQLEPGCWDAILAAYLFRNVAAGERDGAIAEAFELLAPGGWLVVQDYSVAGRREARWRWHFTCWLVIIPLGLILDRNFSLYRYLWRSVVDFDSLHEFGELLAAAGFTEIARQGATGWQRGILHTFVARKPTHQEHKL